MNKEWLYSNRYAGCVQRNGRGKAQRNVYYEFLGHENIDIDIYVHNNKI